MSFRSELSEKHLEIQAECGRLSDSGRVSEDTPTSLAMIGFTIFTSQNRCTHDMLIMVAGFALILLHLPIAAAVTCYGPSGNRAIGAGWDNHTNNVCDHTAAVSICCSTDDYCLSNGLCFAAGASNHLQFQGCTDPNWGAPCHKFCTGDNQDLFSCESLNALRYCCGPDPAPCCSSSRWTSIPVGTVVLRPYQLSALVTPTMSGSGPTTSTIPTSNSSQTSIAIPTATKTPPANGPSPKALGIGLGLGLPLGLALLALLFLLYRELRKYNTSKYGAAASTNRTKEGNGTAIDETVTRPELGRRLNRQELQAGPV